LELRSTLSDWGRRNSVTVLLPDRALTTDNAAMIAWAGLLRYHAGQQPAGIETNARSRWPLGEGG
jgi:N6-L-threonylcarbamoyladenine synthase